MRDEANEKWLNSIVKNQKLRSLNIQYTLNDKQWKLIAGNLPLLDEIKTYWESRNECNGLIDLMNRETNLKKVTLNMKVLPENYTILSDLLYPKWQIDEEFRNNLQEITLVRNN